MSTRYYRLEYPEAIAAWEDYERACYALEARAKAFAEQYPNAKPVFASSIHGLRFHGLRFTPPNPSPLWTIPRESDGHVQRPRSSLPRSFKGDRAAANKELNALNDAWRADGMTRIGGGAVQSDLLWASFGTNWGELLFSGIQRFRSGEAIYVATSAKLDPRAVEITGGEFDAAKGGAA
ncbi:hypothetical protein [Dyella sp.]|uniref:hypothetical protein n=1 Tax=Dyella sp. TaxID=1869338 RepID=UPI003F80C7F9